MRVTRKTLCVSFSIVFELKTALKEVKNLKKRRRKLKGKSIGLSLAVPGCFKEMQVRNKEVSTIEVSPDPPPYSIVYGHRSSELEPVLCFIFYISTERLHFIDEETEVQRSPAWRGKSQC